MQGMSSTVSYLILTIVLAENPALFPFRFIKRPHECKHKT